MRTDKQQLVEIEKQWRLLNGAVATGRYLLPLNIIAMNGKNIALRVTGLGLTLVEDPPGSGKFVDHVVMKASEEVHGMPSLERELILPGEKKPLALKYGRDGTGRNLVLEN